MCPSFWFSSDVEKLLAAARLAGGESVCGGEDVNRRRGRGSSFVVRSPKGADKEQVFIDRNSGSQRQKPLVLAHCDGLHTPHVCRYTHTHTHTQPPGVWS